ncbi:phasin family protein [Siccirubricoccus sp. KC 17139]|uniref:Phasin family protein n=1 Tax=Siccirubricoccus soli TaxID=2899147 RepID=A0ABT1DEG2_9PROT|nr:phasin family protein [Siccirubricoccus soli]MCO6419609.1 phasin family protein [Siccirubricoccus soli]MCP2685744.1 phasin family protein [Siccirubricoccus soli]
MAEKKIEIAAEALSTAPPRAPAALPGGIEWLKPFSEAPTALYTNLYRESFGALARALQAQADFARRLAECKGPAEALSCQLDFLRSASVACSEEAQRAYRSLQSTLTSAPG